MQKSATVALVSDNKLLLLQRGSTAPWMPEKFCLPGGKLEANESLIDAAVRELYEETNIKVSHSELSPLIVTYKSGNNKTVFVCNTPVLYYVTLNWEHVSYRWATTQDASTMKLVPGLWTTIKTLCHQGYLN
jgi:8-oxo-dGTP pyrophosphatase MutT (NUDIX family)